MAAARRGLPGLEPGRRRRRGRLCAASFLVLAVLLGAWVVAGNVRADGVARDYFAHSHGSATVVNVTIEGVHLGLPPFWEVDISGDVVDPGNATPSYRSYMRLWIEPLTGFVLVNGTG